MIVIVCVVERLGDGNVGSGHVILSGSEGSRPREARASRSGSAQDDMGGLSV